MKSLNVSRRRRRSGGQPRECPPLNMVDCGKNQNCSWSSKTNKCSKKRVGRPRECPPLNMVDCGKNQNCSWSSKTNKCSKKRVSKAKAANQAPVAVAVNKSVKKLAAKKPAKKVYQAKLIEIDPDNMVKHSEMSKKINEYMKNKKNKVSIGDILYVWTDNDRQEYNFHIVLPGRKAVCLGDGWGMNWEAGGVIDKKDILHKYNVKYDDVLSKDSGNYYFDEYFRGKMSVMEQEIKDEFKKNDLLS